MTRHSWAVILNALLIFVLCGVLLGAFDLQFFHDLEPCPFCLLQRLAMIGVAVGALLNLRFGIRPMHYGVSLLSLLFGSTVSLWQIAMHASPQFPSLTGPVMGLHLYVWALLIFASSLFAIACMLMLYEKRSEEIKPKKIGILCTIAFSILFFTTISNLIATFIQCRWGGC